MKKKKFKLILYDNNNSQENFLIYVGKKILVFILFI